MFFDTISKTSIIAMKSEDKKRGENAFSNHYNFLLTVILGNSDLKIKFKQICKAT